MALAELNRATAYARVGDSKPPRCAASTAPSNSSRPSPSRYVYRAAVSLGSADARSGSIADCTRALELDPRLALAYWIRSQAYVRARDYPRGAADRVKALELNPSLAAQ